MTKKQLEKEADKWLRKYLLCYDCEKKCNCIETNSYCEQQVLKAYVDSAEPREKQIAELEKKLAVSENDREHNDYELVEVYKKVEQLKNEVALWKKASENNSYKAFQFEKENKELKDNFKIAKDNEYEYSSLLTKAKEIIKELVRVEYDDSTNGDYYNESSKVLEQAEQFLKDSEVK